MLADDYIILIPVLSALAYFYFNWRYFVFLQRQKEMPHIRKGFCINMLHDQLSVFCVLQCDGICFDRKLVRICHDPVF